MGSAEGRAVEQSGSSYPLLDLHFSSEEVLRNTSGCDDLMLKQASGPKQSAPRPRCENTACAALSTKHFISMVSPWRATSGLFPGCPALQRPRAGAVRCFIPQFPGPGEAHLPAAGAPSRTMAPCLEPEAGGTF